MFLKIFYYFHLQRKNFIDIFIDFFGYLHVKIYLAVLLILNIALWIAGRYIDKEIADELMILHYNVDFGVNLIDKANKIYIIPLLGFLIIFINLILLINASKHKDKIFISYILFSAAVLANIFLLTGIAAIYLINFK